MRLPVAEITFRTKAAESIIREASRRFPEMFIGAGTILNTADLHRAFDAGAKFAVAPGFNPTVVGEAMKHGYAFAPGICTPSEIEQAYELGCRFFKFFPAEAAAASRCSNPLPRLTNTSESNSCLPGGVTIDNAADWLAVPEVSAAGGTWLNKADAEGIRKAVALAKSL